VKKLLLVAALALVGVAVYAQDVRIGVGATFSPETQQENYTDVSGDPVAGTEEDSFVSFRAIFDAKYVLASVGFATWVADQTNIKIDSVNIPTNVTADWTYIPINLLLKLPFEIGRGSTIFPLLGIEYDINLTYTQTATFGNATQTTTKDSLSSDDSQGLNHLYVKAGIGADFAVGNNVFLRPEILFAYKIPNASDQDEINNLQDDGATSITLSTYKFDFGLSILFGL